MLVVPPIQQQAALRLLRSEGDRLAGFRWSRYTPPRLESHPRVDRVDRRSCASIPPEPCSRPPDFHDGAVIDQQHDDMIVFIKAGMEILHVAVLSAMPSSLLSLEGGWIQT
jgi:hypothetical protein